MSTEQEKPYDIFELCTALLLGLAAIGAAIAGQQAGQWGGKQMDAFGEANTIATKAATQYNEDMVLLNADYAAVANAKIHILEARDAGGAERARHLEIANYFYTTQLTENAYRAMELPMQFYVEDETETAAEPAAPPATAAPAAPAEDNDETPAPSAPATAAVERDIPDAAMFASLATELDEDYSDSMLVKGEQMFAAADVRFAEGRQANINGDLFDLAAVFFTIALFFAGLGLVFRTKVRWRFFYTGAFVFLASLIFMVTLNWTT